VSSSHSHARQRILALVLPVACLLPAVPLAHATLAAWRAVLAPGPAAVEDVVAAPAGTAGLLLTGWLALVVSVSAANALWPGMARRSPRLAAASRALAPALLRRGLAVLLGASTALSTAAPGPACSPAAGCAAPVVRVASASDPGSDPGDLDPGWWPKTPPPGPGSGGVRYAATPAPVSPRAVPSHRVPASMPGPHPRPALAEDTSIVVRRGDTLWDIAARHLGTTATVARIAAAWPRWYRANRTVIGPDPDHLEPGQRLRPPPEVSPDRDPAPVAALDHGGQG
jgi:resuscitation-promoting factor RpfA